MSEKTKIQWCHHTFNPWRGCSKVNAGCTNCYAEVNRSVKIHDVKWGTEKQGGTRVRLSDAGWKEPLKWNRQAGGLEHIGGHNRPRVFCASLADIFEDWQGPILDHNGGQLCKHTEQCGYRPPSTSLPSGDQSCGACGGWCKPVTMDDLRADLFWLIDATPNLDWMLLTKRPENIKRMWLSYETDSRDGNRDYRRGNLGGLRMDNVWLGASCSDQATTDKAIPQLLKCRDLASVLFVSAEPLIGPLNFRWAKWCPVPFNTATGKTDELDGLRMLDLVITGGESGPNARPCNVEWIRDIGKQCQAAGVKWFNKQLGSNIHAPINNLDASRFWPKGTKVSDQSPEPGTWKIDLRDPKGGNMFEWSEDLRVRQMPIVEASK